jgi:hypothetical protein
VSLDGQVQWVLGGTTSDFTGDASSWSRQHGVDLLSENRLVYFNNGEMGGSSTSQAIEVELDLDAKTATRVWSYDAEPGIQNLQLGDVNRLENGNTVVCYSTQGILHEVDADGELVQEMVWPLGGAYGYAIWRETLYGAPPR